MEATVESSPLQRLGTFVLGLGTFVLFGLLGMCAYMASGGSNDPQYDKQAEKRINERNATQSAQAERLEAAPVDVATAVGTLSSKKPTVTAKPVPGTSAFEKWMAEQAAASAPTEEPGSEEKPAEPAEPVVAEAVKITLEALPGGMMKFKQTELTVKAGAEVELTFVNPDVLQHNFLLLKQGTKDKVGGAADKMLTDPNAMKNAFIPQEPEIKELILAYSGLLNPGQSEVIKFTAPAEAGDYPYICTFPGHWRLMFGTLKVTP